MLAPKKIDLANEEQHDKQLNKKEVKYKKKMTTKKTTTKKKIKKMQQDFIDYKVKGNEIFENRDIGSFDWRIGTNMTNDLLVDKTFIETIDADKLNMALKYYNPKYFGKLQYKDEYGKTHKLNIVSDDEEYALKTYHQFYSKLLDNLDVIKTKDDTKYELRVSYTNFNKSLQKVINNGRIHPIGSLSISQILRELRHYISNDLYYDFDFKCSAQRLLCGIFEKYKLDYPLLYMYITDRENILKDVIDEYKINRDEAKQLFTMETFGGNCLNYLQNKGCIPMNKNNKIHNYLKAFHSEMQANIMFLFNHNELKEIKDIIVKTITDEKKQTKSFICKIYHMCEMECLKIVYEKACEMEIISPVCSRCVLAHDGIMIEKKSIENSDYSIEEFLQEVNEEIAESTGLKTIELILKPQDEGKTMEENIKKMEFVKYLDKFYNKYGITKKQVYKLDKDEKQMADLYLDQQKGVIMTTAKKDKDKIETGELFKREKGSGIWKIINDIQFKHEYIEYMKDFITYIEKLINNEWRTLKNEKAHYRKSRMRLSDLYVKYCNGNEEEIAKNPFKDRDDMIDAMFDGLEGKQKTKLETLRLNTRKESMLNSICSAVKTQTCDNNFYDKLDKDPYILGFNNGVLDLRTMEFRSCNDDEYVRKTCGYDFIDIEKCDKETKEKILEFEKEMEEDIRNNYETDSEYEFNMQSISRSLQGAEISNKEQKITIKIGSGANGKGMEQEFCMNIFGEYGYILNPESMKHGLKMNDPNIYGLYLARIAFISEPDGKWNNTIFKNLTADEIMVRTLYMSEGKKIKPCPIIVSTNEPIMFQKICANDSIPRRCNNMEMTSKYKDEDDFDPNNPYHRKKKQGYKWCDLRKMAGMRILMKYFQMYKDNGSNISNNIPLRFKNNTMDYISEMNVEERFIKEYIHHTTEKKDKHLQNLLAYNTRTKDGQQFQGVVDYILEHKDMRKRFSNRNQVLNAIKNATGKEIYKKGGKRCYDINGNLVSDLQDNIHKAKCFELCYFGNEIKEEEE